MITDKTIAQDIFIKKRDQIALNHHNKLEVDIKTSDDVLLLQELLLSSAEVTSIKLNVPNDEKSFYKSAQKAVSLVLNYCPEKVKELDLNLPEIGHKNFEKLQNVVNNLEILRISCNLDVNNTNKLLSNGNKLIKLHLNSLDYFFPDICLTELKELSVNEGELDLSLILRTAPNITALECDTLHVEGFFKQNIRLKVIKVRLIKPLNNETVKKLAQTFKSVHTFQAADLNNEHLLSLGLMSNLTSLTLLPSKDFTKWGLYSMFQVTESKITHLYLNNKPLYPNDLIFILPLCPKLQVLHLNPQKGSEEEFLEVILSYISNGIPGTILEVQFPLVKEERCLQLQKGLEEQGINILKLTCHGRYEASQTRHNDPDRLRVPHSPIPQSISHVSSHSTEFIGTSGSFITALRKLASSVTTIHEIHKPEGNAITELLAVLPQLEELRIFCRLETEIMDRILLTGLALKTLICENIDRFPSDTCLQNLIELRVKKGTLEYAQLHSAMPKLEVLECDCLIDNGQIVLNKRLKFLKVLTIM